MHTNFVFTVTHTRSFDTYGQSHVQVKIDIMAASFLSVITRILASWHNLFRRSKRRNRCSRCTSGLSVRVVRVVKRFSVFIWSGPRRYVRGKVPNRSVGADVYTRASWSQESPLEPNFFKGRYALSPIPLLQFWDGVPAG